MAPQAPEPAQAAPGAPNLKGLKRDKKFKQFLQEKHQKGEGKVTHPNPKLRRRYRDGIKFWTAMKYPEFHDPLMREFEAWKQEQAEGGTGAGRPAPADRQVGAPVGNLANLREGDTFQYKDGKGPKWEVIIIGKASMLLKNLDDGEKRPVSHLKTDWGNFNFTGLVAEREVGQPVPGISQLKQDDILQHKDGGSNWRVQEVRNGRITMQKLDDAGQPTGAPLFHDPKYLGKYRFVELANKPKPKPERPRASSSSWTHQDPRGGRLA